MLLGVWCMASVQPASGRDTQAAKSHQPVHTITGTLALLDISTGKGMLKTDLDKPVFFEVSRPEHFAGMSIGDRVTVQLDDEGRTVKVIEALPAEVHEPPPAPVPVQ